MAGVSALSSGLDQLLGASARLKHFGTRRLGRSDLTDLTDVYDNVWDFDVSEVLRDAEIRHAGVFECDMVMALSANVLRGFDRGVLLRKHGAR